MLASLERADQLTVEDNRVGSRVFKSGRVGVVMGNIGNTQDIFNQL
jgi:hypothetical protein